MSVRKVGKQRLRGSSDRVDAIEEDERYGSACCKHCGPEPTAGRQFKRPPMEWLIATKLRDAMPRAIKTSGNQCSGKFGSHNYEENFDSGSYIVRVYRNKVKEGLKILTVWTIGLPRREREELMLPVRLNVL